MGTDPRSGFKMTIENPLELILPTLDAPDELPEVIEHLVMEVEFTEGAVAAGVAHGAVPELEETVDDVRALMSAGFLCRSEQSPGSHLLRVAAPDPSGIRIELESTAVHRNLVPMLVRLMFSLHQTPPEAFDRVVAAFGGDEQAAREAYAGVDYSETIAGLRFQTVEGRGEERAFELQSSVPDADMARPVGWPEGAYGEWERVVIGGFDGSAELDFTLEDAWLSVSMMSAFVPLGQPAGFEPGEEEFFFREAKSGRQLVCYGLSVEYFWLGEWLTCLVGGASQEVTRLEYIAGSM